MEFRLFHIFTFLCVTRLVAMVVVESHGTSMSPQEAYWKSVLPNTPIPKAITQLLHPASSADGKSVLPMEPGEKLVTVAGFGVVYNLYSSAIVNMSRNHSKVAPSTFFLEKDMRRGASVKLHFTKTSSSATFLPRHEADAIPFSSTEFLEILKRYSVNQGSIEADVMNLAITLCEEAASKGEDKYCATSLESMIDFTTLELGQGLEVLSTETETKQTTVQNYTIIEITKRGQDEAVVCHKLVYPYAVYYCHKIIRTTPYMVSLIGADGTKVKAAVVCHSDTSAFSPNHKAFKVLKVKPGSATICHYLLMDTIVWVPSHVHVPI